jgi:DNA-binding transcriptional LysR family regulator
MHFQHRYCSNSRQDSRLTRRPAIDLRHLEILRALVETGKTTAAAQKLGTSQSAVSRGLAQLEAELGRLLFAREGGRLVPTAEAFALHEQLQPVLAFLARIGGEGGLDIAGGVLRLAAPSTLAHCFLPTCIAGFIHQNPQIEVNFEVLASDALIGNVAEERIDLGLTDTMPVHAGVRSELLVATDAVCIMPTGHRLAAREFIEPQDLDGENFIALIRRHSGRFFIDQVLERAGVKPRIIIETATSLSAGAFVREGLGIALLNPFPIVAQLGPQVAVRDFQPRIPYRTSFLVSSHTPVSAAAAAFMAHARASLNNERFATRD